MTEARGSGVWGLVLRSLNGRSDGKRKKDVVKGEAEVTVASGSLPSSQSQPGCYLDLGPWNPITKSTSMSTLKGHSLIASANHTYCCPISPLSNVPT